MIKNQETKILSKMEIFHRDKKAVWRISSVYSSVVHVLYPLRSYIFIGINWTSVRGVILCAKYLLQKK